MTQVLKLTKPIPAAGGTDVSELTFREMIGADLIACGNPIGLRTSNMKSGEGFGTTDPEATSRLISKLTGVPLSSVGQMTSRDFMKASAIVSGFLADPEDDTTPASS